jgi:tetratricopeptide (TPR) repeat protein
VMVETRGENDALSGHSLMALGEVLKEQGDLGAAEEMLTAALAALRAHHEYGHGHPETLKALRLLAVVNKKLNKLEAAEKCFREIVPAYAALYGPNHSNTAVGMLQLACVLDMKGAKENLAEADKLAVKALEINVQSLGEDHRTTVDNVQFLYGLASKMDNKRGLDCYKAALRKHQRMSKGGLGPKSP